MNRNFTEGWHAIKLLLIFSELFKIVLKFFNDLIFIITRPHTVKTSYDFYEKYLINMEQ